MRLGLYRKQARQDPVSSRPCDRATPDRGIADARAGPSALSCVNVPAYFEMNLFRIALVMGGRHDTIIAMDPDRINRFMINVFLLLSMSIAMAHLLLVELSGLLKAFGQWAH